MTDPERVSQVEESDPDALSTATVGVVGALVLVVVIVAVQGLYERTARAELDRKVVREKPEELEVARADQLSKFTPRLVDPVRGIAAISIEDAMAAMLRAPDPAAPVVGPREAPPPPQRPAAGKARSK